MGRARPPDAPNRVGNCRASVSDAAQEAIREISYIRGSGRKEPETAFRGFSDFLHFLCNFCVTKRRIFRSTH
jgi:hypothetical protein